MKIILSFNFNNKLFIEDIWVNLITGVQVQIIDLVLSHFKNITLFYSPSPQLRSDINESVIKVFKKNKNFIHCTYENLTFEHFSKSTTLITNDIKLAKNYVILTNNNAIIFIPYLKRNEINISNKFYLAKSINDIKEILKNEKFAKI